ncbi:hypothetical protein DRO61_11180 [Candidatus Bathyarchaeota archaeon]|nr:MAG: hypothetical protein DRO61_11180 [Candidatus Bathyarchaeota archaeon]
MSEAKSSKKYPGWYYHKEDPAIYHPYDQSCGGPKEHPDYKGGYMSGIHFTWNEKTGILHFTEAGRCYDSHGYGTIAAATIKEAEFLISKFLTLSA